MCFHSFMDTLWQLFLFLLLCLAVDLVHLCELCR
jgi:hypothetical protein